MHRKKPSFERSGGVCDGEVSDSLETLSSRMPLWVKPNSSNGMMARESEWIEV